MTSKKSFISRNYLIVTIIALFFWLGRGITNPILPLLVRSYGYSMTELGLVSLSRSLGFAFFEPITGWLYDRIEMKRIVILTSFIGVLVMPLYTLAIDLWQFGLISFLLAGASAGISSPTRAAIAHLVPEEQRGKAYGVFQSIRISGMMVGPILGGYLAQNINYNIPFYVSALPLVGSMITGFLLPKMRQTESVHDSTIQFEEKEKTSYKKILTTGFTTFFIARVLSVLVGFFSMSLIVVYANETLGATETEVGLISTIRSGINVMVGLGFGVLANRIRKEKLILLSMILSGFTYLGFFAVQNILQLYLIGAILGIGRAIYNLGLITLMIDRVPSTHYGSAMGLYGLAEDVGGMLGSIVIGSIYDIWGMPTVLYFLFSDMITNALVSLIAFKKFHYKNKK